MAGPGDLHAVAQELLDAASEALDAIPDLLDDTYAGAPERQFVSPGLPVIDCCELLATWVDPIAVAARSPQVLAADLQVTRPTFNLIVTRCIPMGRMEGSEYIPPTAAQLTAAAAQTDADAWAIWNHIWNLLQAEPDALIFSKCFDLIWNAASAQVPSGGCAGWRFSFTAGLDGYSEDIGT